MRYATSLLWRLPLGLVVGGLLGGIGNTAVPLLGALGGFVFGLYVCLHINWGEPEPPVRRPRGRARSSDAWPSMPTEARKKIAIERGDADLLLSFCEPGSTLEEPTITEENYRHFLVA